MEQIHRAERYLERIRGIYEGCPHKYEDASFYEDDVISFFIHCHHISDWIIKLNRVGETKTAINKFINEHNELIICADLCNGQKHFRLERVRGDRQPHVSGKEWIITTYTPEADKPVIFRAKYRIVAGNEIYDALGLAEKCIDLWRGYIRVLALKAI
ncbi:MAG: hypothetical protein ISR74_07295 [Candidatus Thioglobus sp.]|nr:hypothetical protein [Candidatus Thioglobus sp.]